MWTVTAREAQSGAPVASAELRQGSLRIGRNAHCELHLPSPTVSRQHARIHLRDDGRTELIDEGSANGCSVDGQRVVDPVVLSAGSVIEIGVYLLSLEPLAAEISPGAPVQDEPAAATARSAAASLTDLLEHQIGAIQSHRSTLADKERLQREAFEAGWTSVLEAAQVMRMRFADDPRVPYFFINREQTEIVARVAAAKGGPTVTLSLSRTVPGESTADGQRAWFRVLGEEPTGYKEPDKAMEELVRRLASRLA